MKRKIIFIALLVLTFTLNAGNDDYVSITKISKLKKYNKNAVWRRVPCKKCHGTGSKTKQWYNAKTNSMVKRQIPCPYCKGRGYRGKSKM